MPLKELLSCLPSRKGGPDEPDGVAKSWLCLEITTLEKSQKVDYACQELMWVMPSLLIGSSLKKDFSPISGQGDISNFQSLNGDWVRNLLP